MNEGHLTDGNEPTLASLAARSNDAALQVQIADRQGAKFAHPQAGRVHEVKHRCVQRASIGRGIGRREQAFDLLERENAREPGRGARTVEQSGRILDDGSLAHQKPEESPQCRQLPRVRPRAQTAPHVVDHERRKHLDPDLCRVHPAAHVIREPVQIARVGLERIFGESPLDTDVIEVGVDPPV
jgi:hypothetical protein